jgi:hypothetical protein
MYREPADQPSRLSVDYPEQSLNRLTTFFRLFAALPILIVLGAVGGGAWEWSYDNGKEAAAAAGGVLFFGPLLMILFRQKYPRWWVRLQPSADEVHDQSDVLSRADV